MPLESTPHAQSWRSLICCVAIVIAGLAAADEPVNDTAQRIRLLSESARFEEAQASCWGWTTFLPWSHGRSGVIPGLFRFGSRTP